MCQLKRKIMSGYTEEAVRKMAEEYNANPCLETVDKLSIMFNKPRKSIISKLSKEGLYLTRGYTDKLGNAPITKLELVRSLEDMLDVRLMGLDKAPKTALKHLEAQVSDISSALEGALQELASQHEVTGIRSEMKRVKDAEPWDLLYAADEGDQK